MKQFKKPIQPQGYVWILERERELLRADRDRLDALDSLPWALMLYFDEGAPKADSVPKIREQIDAFLARRSKCLKTEAQS